ncbi:ABC transporter substrate-binding protein [Ectothiorhodospiraceae bacterium WFHF3C12]|nr:ABC transporter substrate-binding protein [Ectothiorhodospiraceae bacterium WFHF3C12]
MIGKSLTSIATVAAFAALSSTAMAADEIPVGHLAAYTGPTSAVGKIYGQGIEDAIAYINDNGGIDGRMINKDTVDYSYAAPRAIATYKRWTSGLNPVVIQGWGTADTEALVQFVARDEIVYMSASYSGHLTDPTGKSPKTEKAAPYNFFYGPSYSDGCRAMVAWAKQDWEDKGMSGTPKFVHMGDNHPYPNAPKAACQDYAESQGFEVLNPIVYSLKPGDAKGQCLSLEDAGADYAYLANTSGSNISLLKSCATVGVDTQFVTNVWGFDEEAVDAAGEAGDGIVFPVGAARWGADVPGMETIKAISRMSDSSGEKSRALHYMRGVCSVYFMRDAMKRAAEGDGITGPNVKAALESMEGHVPAELEGVCLPHTWTPENHRGTTKVMVYQNEYNGGDFRFNRLTTIDLPRRDDWLGY